jgi:hypothetical protein
MVTGGGPGYRGIRLSVTVFYREHSAGPALDQRPTKPASFLSPADGGEGRVRGIGRGNGPQLSNDKSPAARGSRIPGTGPIRR